MKKNKHYHKTTPKRNLSWVVEREALCEIGDRKTRVIMAIFMARRGAKKETFFVPPHILAYWNLTSKDLHWGYGLLEGVIIETINSKRGKFRVVKLLPRWEHYNATPNSSSEEVSVSSEELIRLYDEWWPSLDH